MQTDASAAGTDSSASPLTPRGLVRLLRRQRVLICCTLALAVGAATFYLAMATPRYRSTAQLTILPNAATLDATSSRASAFRATHIERLRSGSVLALALGNPEVRQLPTFSSGGTPTQILRDGLLIQVGSMDDVVRLSFDSPYPDDSAIVANAVVDAFVQFESRPRATGSSQLVGGYRAQIDRDEAACNKIAIDMRELELKYGVVLGGDQDVDVRRLASLTKELKSAQLDAIRAEAQLQKAARPDSATSQPVTTELGLTQPGDTQPGASQPATTPVGALALSSDEDESMRRRLLELETKLQDMKQHYLPSHPAVRATLAEIDELKQSQLRVVRGRWDLAKQRAQALQQAVNEQRKHMSDAASVEAQLKVMRSEIASLRKHADGIEARIAQTEVAGRAPDVDIDFFDRAQVSYKVRPQPAAILAGALLLGTVGGILLGLLKEWADDRFLSAEDAENSLDIPVLGVVPDISPTETTPRRKPTDFERSNAWRDATRALATAIQLNTPHNWFRTLLVTAPSAADGSAFAAAQIAVAMARSGSRTLLIDAHLGAPLQHHVFNVPEVVGLTSILEGNETVAGAIRHTAVERLSLLPCGPKPETSADLLNSPLLPEMIEGLVDQFDRIVIDGPSIHGAADARIIAAFSDATLLVIAADRSGRRKSRAARDALQSIGAQLLGILITLRPGLDAGWGDGSRRSRAARSGHSAHDPETSPNLAGGKLHPNNA